MPPRRTLAAHTDESDATDSPRPLRALLPELRARDNAAWAELVRRYERLVWSIPRAAGLDGADAEDVFQSTWQALLRQIDLIRDADALPSWIITTARRLSQRTRARLARQAVGLPEGEVEPEESGERPEDSCERLERRQQVLEALEALSPRCRTLLERLFGFANAAGKAGGSASHGDSTSYQSVAADLGLPMGSIGPTRQRCLARLAVLLKQSRGGRA